MDVVLGGEEDVGFSEPAAGGGFNEPVAGGGFNEPMTDDPAWIRESNPVQSPDPPSQFAVLLTSVGVLDPGREEVVEGREELTLALLVIVFACVGSSEPGLLLLTELVASDT